MSQQNQNTQSSAQNNEILMQQIKSILSNIDTKDKPKAENDSAEQNGPGSPQNRENQGAYVSINLKVQEKEEGQILKDLMLKMNGNKTDQNNVTQDAKVNDQDPKPQTEIKVESGSYAQPVGIAQASQQSKTQLIMSIQNGGAVQDNQNLTNDLLQSQVGIELIKKLHEGKIEFTQFVSKLKQIIPPTKQAAQADKHMLLYNSNPQQNYNHQNQQVDQINQNMTQIEESNKNIYQNQTHGHIQYRFKNLSNQSINQNQKNQTMQQSITQTNFDVPSNINNFKSGEVKQSDTSEKSRHNSQNRSNHGAIINKIQNQTFFEDVFPQVNTLQKMRPQNQFQLLNEMLVRTQKTQKSQQQTEQQNYNQQDHNYLSNSISMSQQANPSNNSGTASVVMNQRAGSSDVNQQPQLIKNIKIMNMNEFHKMPRAIQSQFNIQKQSTQTTQDIVNPNKNVSKDSRQSRQSKQSNKSKQSRTSDGQISTSLHKFQQNRVRKVFENDSQSHDEAQAEPSTKNFQGSAWKPHRKRDVASSNLINTDDQNPTNQSQTDIQNMLMKVIIQKINQEIKVSKDNQTGSISTNLTTVGEMAGQNSFVGTDDKNQSYTYGIDAQRVEQKAADIQQIIIEQIKEKAQKLQAIQQRQDLIQQSMANNIQNSATDKDDTAGFPLPTQMSQASPNEQNQLDCAQQDTIDLNNNKQMNECEPQNTETVQENPTLMSKEDVDKSQNNQNTLQVPSNQPNNIDISQINLSNFPGIPEPIKALIIQQQNQDSGSGNGNSGSRNGSGSGNGHGSGNGSGGNNHNSSTGENEGVNIGQLQFMIANYIPQDAQQAARQAALQVSEIVKPSQQEVNTLKTEAEFCNLKPVELIQQSMRQFQQQSIGVQNGQPQMRYNGPTSSSGSGEDQNRQVQNIKEVSVSNNNIQQNQMMRMMTQNGIQTVNDLKNFLTNLQGQQEMAKLLKPQNQPQQPPQSLLGKRLMNDRTDAVDSALLQKQLQAPLNLIQQIQNVQSSNQPNISVDQNQICVNKTAFPQDQMKHEGQLDQCTDQEAQMKSTMIKDEEGDGYDDDTPMQIRLRNQIRNNQSKLQFRQVKLELLKAIKTEKDMSKTIIDAKPKRPHHNMGGEMFRGSRYRGVSKNKNKWQMMIMINQKKVYIGAIQNEFDAARFYDHIAIISQGLSAKTNFKYSASKIQQIVQDYDIESQDCSSNENYPTQSLSSNDNQLLHQINVFKNQRVQDRNTSLQMMDQQQLESMYRPAALNQSLLQNSDFKNKLTALLNLQQQSQAQQQISQVVSNIQNNSVPVQIISQQQAPEINSIQQLLERQSSQQNVNQMLKQMRPAQVAQPQPASSVYENLLSKLKQQQTQQHQPQMNLNQGSDLAQNLAKMIQQKLSQKQINTDSWQLIQNHMSQSNQQNMSVQQSMIQQIVRQQSELNVNKNHKN